jgi:hypothetical protein
MTPQEKILAVVQTLPEYVSAGITYPSTFQLEQTGDTSVFTVDGVYRRGTDTRSALIMFNTEFAKQVDFNTYPASLLMEDIVFCECEPCRDHATNSYTNIFDNMGEPPIFYLDPTTGRSRRVKISEPPPVEITESFLALTAEIRQLPGVTDLRWENSISAGLDHSVGGKAIVFFLIVSDPASEPCEQLQCGCKYISAAYISDWCYDVAHHAEIITNLRQRLAEN